MWGFFKRSTKPTRRDDTLWLTEQAKYVGIISAIREAKAAGSAVLIVAHFPETRERFARELQEAGLEVMQLTSTLPASALRSRLVNADAPIVVLASHVQGSPFVPNAPSVTESAGREIRAIVVERYPLRERDDAATAFLESVATTGLWNTHVSIEDVLMRAFSGEQTRSILMRLGMKPGDSIQHAMLNRSIRRAQEKIRQHLFADIPDRSERGWSERLEAIATARR